MQVTTILSATSIFMLVISIIAQPLGINVIIFSLFALGIISVGLLISSPGANKFTLEQDDLHVSKDLQEKATLPQQ